MAAAVALAWAEMIHFLTSVLPWWGERLIMASASSWLHSDVESLRQAGFSRLSLRVATRISCSGTITRTVSFWGLQMLHKVQICGRIRMSGVRMRDGDGSFSHARGLLTRQLSLSFFSLNKAAQANAGQLNLSLVASFEMLNLSTAARTRRTERHMTCLVISAPPVP